MTILRRLDCMLAPTRDKVRQIAGRRATTTELLRRQGQAGDRAELLQHLEYDFASLLADPDGLRANLIDYIAGFSDEHRRVRAVRVRERDRCARRRRTAC